MAPDLQQNIIVTVYLLFSHNYEAFAYFMGIILGISLSLYRPSRVSTFILLAFAILLFSYEYDKHIITGLREQTLRSLITVQPHFKLQRIVNLILSDLFPILFYIAGWGFLFLALILSAIGSSHHKKEK
ncbi:hypothetical protein HYW55_00675 [Candidatus Gottesmanbacteria bacterium]|nr:hypothetical protein [Candidatus Gottesmanbacteria bacterium]